MEIESSHASLLTTKRFRCLVDQRLELSPGLNIIAGQNAQGKTSILEALYLCATGQLLRGRRDSEAICLGQHDAFVEVRLEPSGSKIQVELRAGVRKRVLLNEKVLPRPSDVMGRLPIVTFSMEDLAIVRGEPSDRRRFLDLELSQNYPGYLKALTAYRRSLEQRNALLKASQERHVSEDEFQPWELSLAANGESIRVRRSDFIDKLSPKVAQFMHELGGESIRLELQVSDNEPLELQLRERRRADVSRGSTSVGPHRDDLGIFIEEADARAFASQGQQRSAVMAIKAGVFGVITELHGRPPTLLLDDVFSDLDAHRRSRLVGLVRDTAGQVLITCTEPGQAGEALISVAKVFHVEKGLAREWNG